MKTEVRKQYVSNDSYFSKTFTYVHIHRTLIKGDTERQTLIVYIYAGEIWMIFNWGEVELSAFTRILLSTEHGLLLRKRNLRKFISSLDETTPLDLKPEAIFCITPQT